MSKNNQILLDEIIKQEMKNMEYSKDINTFFEFYSAVKILKSFDLTYDDIGKGLQGGSNDGGIDSAYIFVNGDLVSEDWDSSAYKKNVDIELILIQSKYEASFGETALLKIAGTCSNLLDLDFNGKDFYGRYSEELLKFFELFKETYLSLIMKKPRLKVSIYYASKGVDVHPNVVKQSEDLKDIIKDKLTESEVDVHFYGAEKLVKISRDRPNEVFKLKVSESPISTSEKVFIALSNIADYYKFICDENGKILKHIFESNVRDYQGRTNVNTEIYETLKKTGKEEFWWLNNGVTILASDVTAPGGKELTVHNPEIVNGLQTSSEIFRFYSENKERVASETRDILIRIIVPDGEESRDRIIRATNSQTPIPKSSLRATDQIHRQIEEHLKVRGLYYDRRKNFYKNEGRKPREIISIQFLSQCLISVLMQQPDFARARPSTLLEDDSSYEKLFHKNNDLNTYYLLALWGREVENYLKERRLYTATEMNDIKFYVLFSVCCFIVGTVRPSNSLIAKQSKDALKEDLLKESSDLVFGVYRRLGGTDKVAKGSRMLDELRAELKDLLSVGNEYEEA